MKTSRRTVFALVSILGVVSVGTVGLSASPTCQRFIVESKNRLIRNRVSRATLARWAAWGKQHPKYQPHARPRYKMTHEEVIRRLEIACEVPQIEIAGDLPPEPPPFLIPLTPMEFSLPPAPPIPVTVTTAGVVPPSTPFALAAAPSVSPFPNVAPVPEPSNWVLAMTALLFFAGLARKQLTRGFDRLMQQS